MDEEVTEELSMRDSIEAAITTLGDESGMEPSTQPAEVIDAKSEATKTQASAETAEGAVSRETEQADIIDGKREATGNDPASGSPGDEQSAAGNVDKAPASWQPEAREGWANLPEGIRQEIHKREGEINKALMDGSENRKQGQKFSDITSRYASVIAAEGVTDPIQGFEAMMRTMSELRMGTPQQKAMKIAQFINGYGVSVEILDQILSGQSTPQGGNGATPPGMEYIDQKLAPVNDLLSRLSAQERQQNYQRNQEFLTEVQNFSAANEFYNDVKNDMADMVEMAEKRNYTMPLAEAYAKACALNPQVSAVMAERAKTDQLAHGGATLTAKRNAGSSLMSGRQQGMPAAEDMSLRDTLSAAFDAQTG